MKKQNQICKCGHDIMKHRSHSGHDNYRCRVIILPSKEPCKCKKFEGEKPKVYIEDAEVISGPKGSKRMGDFIKRNEETKEKDKDGDTLSNHIRPDSHIEDIKIINVKNVKEFIKRLNEDNPQGLFDKLVRDQDLDRDEIVEVLCEYFNKKIDKLAGKELSNG